MSIDYRPDRDRYSRSMDEQLHSFILRVEAAFDGNRLADFKRPMEGSINQESAHIIARAD